MPRLTASADDAELASLLVAWRATHDPQLEEPIARLGEELARSAGPLVARSKAELEKVWLALVAKRKARDVDRLLDAPWPGVWKTALPRIAALAKLDPDPRLAIKLARIAATYDSWASHPLHRAIAAVLARSPTRSLLPALDAIEAVRRTSDVEEHASAEIYAPVRAAVAALKPTTARVDLSHARSKVSRASHDLPALHAQHAANPADLGLRAVLADALQADGDPRGELIALQLASAGGPASAQARKREAQLLAANIDTWTRALPNVEKASRRFERGFLVALRSSARGNALERSFERPEWTTVEELQIDGYGSDLRPLLDRMPLLRVFDCPHDEVLAQLAQGGPYRALVAIGCGSKWFPEDRKAFPNLAVVAGTWLQYGYSEDAFVKHQHAARALGVHAIVHVDFGVDHLAQALRHRALGPPEVRFAIGLLGSGHRGFNAGCWKLRVERDRPSAEAVFTSGNEAQRADLAEILTAFRSARIDHVIVRTAPRHRDAIAQLARGFPKLAIQIEPGATALASGPERQPS